LVVVDGGVSARTRLIVNTQADAPVLDKEQLLGDDWRDFFEVAKCLQPLAKGRQERVPAPFVDGTVARQGDSRAGGRLDDVTEFAAPSGEETKTAGTGSESKAHTDEEQQEAAPTAGPGIVSTIPSPPRTRASRIGQPNSSGVKLV